MKGNSKLLSGLIRMSAPSTKVRFMEVLPTQLNTGETSGERACFDGWHNTIFTKSHAQGRLDVPRDFGETQRLARLQSQLARPCELHRHC